jgi:hypothetical protein
LNAWMRRRLTRAPAVARSAPTRARPTKPRGDHVGRVQSDPVGLAESRAVSRSRGSWGLTVGNLR